MKTLVFIPAELIGEGVDNRSRPLNRWSDLRGCAGDNRFHNDGVLFGDMGVSDHSYAATISSASEGNQRIKGNLKVFVCMKQNRCESVRLLAVHKCPRCYPSGSATNARVIIMVIF